MTTYDRTMKMIETLRRAAEAAHAPARPNGTTQGIQRDMEVQLEEFLDDLLIRVCAPSKPNGTTQRVLNILENG